MKKETLIIAIFIALIILWITETIGMRKTAKILGGAIDIGFAPSKIGIQKINAGLG